MTEFKFENVYRAGSTTEVLAAYFDPDQLAAQDALASLGDRTVVESKDDGATLACTWRVASLKQLPVFVRPFVSGGRLRYVESMTWRRADDAIDFTVQPEILGGRVQLAAVYQMSSIGDGQILRRYQGTITVNIKLLSGRIERGILAELERTVPILAACTQTWLDRPR